MRTTVYVDGFNLYFGCLKGTAYRWLDLKAFVENVVPKKADVTAIRYFTAKVTALPGFNPNAPVKQETYLRALGTLANVTVHLGEYRSRKTKMPRYPLSDRGNEIVTVVRSDEKGSDVNIASYMLLDGFRGTYEQAIVISNDSDLEPAPVWWTPQKRLLSSEFRQCNRERDVQNPSRKTQFVA